MSEVVPFPLINGDNPFVEPDTVEIPLTERHWIRVRKRLNVGQQKIMQSAGLKTVQADADADVPADAPPKVTLDMTRLALARVLAYVVEWSFRNAKGKPVAVTRESVSALDPDVFDLIDKKLDEHVKAVEEEKKARAGSTEQTSN